MNRTLGVILLAAVVLSLNGCVRYGPEPETVPWVDLTRYVGIWHEIASNPVFFNRDLVGVTAEYKALSETQVSVLNTGYEGSLEGKKNTITGTATVVDRSTNSKLKVRFDPFPSNLFPGNYWIVLLDEVNYKYAVVTDNRQFTLFVLARNPEMSQKLYDDILDALEAKQVDVSRLRVTGKLLD